MNFRKMRKNAIKGIISFFAMISLFFYFIWFYITEVNALRQKYPEEIFPEGIPKEALAHWAESFVPIFLLIVVLLVVGAIAYLVFFIISFINATKIEDDEVPLILFVVGIFVPIVGLIGFFFLIRSVHKLEIEEQNRLKQLPESDNIFK